MMVLNVHKPLSADADAGMLKHDIYKWQPYNISTTTESRNDTMGCVKYFIYVGKDNRTVNSHIQNINYTLQTVGITWGEIH